MRNRFSVEQEVIPLVSLPIKLVSTLLLGVLCLFSIPEEIFFALVWTHDWLSVQRFLKHQAKIFHHLWINSEFVVDQHTEFTFDDRLLASLPDLKCIHSFELCQDWVLQQ